MSPAVATKMLSVMLYDLKLPLAVAIKPLNVVGLNVLASGIASSSPSPSGSVCLNQKGFSRVLFGGINTVKMRLHSLREAHTQTKRVWERQKPAGPT